MACRIRSWHTLAEAKEPSYPSLSILDISSLIIVSYFSSISISSQVINVWDRVCTVSPHPQVFPHYTEIHILLRNPLAYKSFLLFKSSAFFIILRIFLLGTLLGTFGRLSPYRRCPLLSFQRFQRFVWNCLLYSSPWSSTIDLREIGGFLLSEDSLKAGNYDHPLQKYRKRKYIKPLYSLSTHAQSSMNPRHCEM